MRFSDDATTTSIIVCAYTLDRWDQLILAIESALAQDPPHETILVIDHNEELLERARAQWPDLIVIANTGPRGLSGGRNTAIAIATGAIVAFLDDDAVAQPGWLATLVEPFSDAAVVAVGGSAEPVWPGEAPDVLPVELLWVVGCSYRGLPEGLAPVRNVMGCSMAFRKDPLLDIGGFNPDTGRVGRLPIGCEETEACIRLRQVDSTRIILHAPAARVRHHVSPDRTRLAYVVHRSWCEGISKAGIARTVGRQDALSAESAYLTRVLPVGVWREARRGTRGIPGVAAILLSVGAAGLGYARGSIAPVRGPARRQPLMRASPTRTRA